MPYKCKLLLAALTTTLMLAAGVCAASANQLSLNETAFELNWTETETTTKLAFTAAGAEIECNLTLAGSLHSSTIAKVSESLVGSITEVGFEECEGGGATVLTGDLPWHVQYDSYTGTLPEIRSITLNIVGIRLAFDPEGALPRCLMGTTQEHPLEIVAEVGGSGELPTIRADEDSGIPLGGEFFCSLGGESHFSGTADVNGGDLTLTLIGGSPPEEDPASLRATPSSVVVEELEESDRFTVRNVGDLTGTLDEPELEGVDRERPEFEVTAPGCESRLAGGRSCVYSIAVNERPLREAAVRIDYDDGEEGRRSISIPVEIAEAPSTGAVLTPSPSEVTVEALEQNAVVAVRNTGGGATATIERVVVETTDREAPEFEVSSPGCASTLADDETCNYVIAVDDRPETSGRITIYYENGLEEARTLSIDVDIAEDPRPAVLEADPAAVDIEALESNDSFVLRNVGEGTATAVIDAVRVEATDRESPEFEVVGPGCSLIVIDEASCTYIVTVNSRPEREGYVVFTYDDGVDPEARTLRIRVDIES